MSRELDFADGFESSTAPSVGFIAATGLQTFASDAAFVTAKGSAAAAGDMYHNTTTSQVRQFNGTVWRDVVASEGAQTIAGNKTFSNDVVVQGNLTVNGTTTTINTETLDVEDSNIQVNTGGNTASANANSAGLTVDISDGTDARIGYDSTLASRFKIGDVGSESQVATTSHTQTLTNKTIDGDDNTIQDLQAGMFKTIIGNALRFFSFDAVGAPITTKVVPSGDVVGTTDAQVLTNKDIDGGTASNSRRITLPKDTTTNLNALTRKQATLFYDTTTNALKLDNGTTLQEVGGSGGGGGGGSLQWIEGANSALIQFANNMRSYSYQSGLSQDLWATVKVPDSYTAGSQITMRMHYYSPDTSGNVLLQTISTLIRQGTDAADSVTNQRTSTNAAVTLGSPANLVRTVTFDLTSSIGEINGVAVSPNDLIKVELTRGTDTATSDVQALVFSADLKFS